MDVDVQVQEALELISQGIRLTNNLMDFIARSVADKLENTKDEYLITNETKEGKQKINDLLRKHKDGIQSLDDNLTKQQVKEYQKEFKKLGVDFSIVKNEKDNYSFFFAGSQANVIEKAMKNIVELNSKVLENQQVKDAQLDLDSEMNNLTDEEKENVNNTFAKYLNGETPDLEKLNQEEKLAFDKMEKLDEVKSDIKQEIQNELKEVEVSPTTEKQKSASKDILKDKLSKLDDKELALFEKRIEYENESTSPSLDTNKSQKLASELKEMQSKYPKETVDKINNIDKDVRELNNYTNIEKSSKLNANEILKETKKHSADRNRKVTKEKESNYSLDSVKKMDKQIKEQDNSKNKTKEKEQSL